MAKETHKQKKVRHAGYFGDPITPPCECGCLEPVPFGRDGLQRFVNSQHVYWWKENTNFYSKMTEKRVELNKPQSIDIKVFRVAVQKLKTEKGWTIKEIADLGGWTFRAYSNYMYDSRYKTIPTDKARDFLRRLAGLPAPQTEYQKEKIRTIRREAQRAGIAISQINNLYNTEKEPNEDQ